MNHTDYFDEDDYDVLEVSDVIDERQTYIKNLMDEGSQRPLVKEDDIDQSPEWMNLDKITRAQRFLHEHFGIFIVNIFLLTVLGLNIPHIVIGLEGTKKSSTPTTSHTRYQRTVSKYFKLWFTADFRSNTAQMFQTFRSIRAAHRAAESGLQRSQPSDHPIINQCGLAIVQSTFLLSIAPARFSGLRLDPQTIGDVTHLVRLVGHYMGMEDKYNVASVEGQPTLEKCNQIKDHLFFGSLDNKHKHFQHMAEALCTGNATTLLGKPAATVDAVLAFLIEVLDGPRRHLPKLDVDDRARVSLLKANVFFVEHLIKYEENVLNKYF